MEISIQSGKEEGEKFSILHLQNTTPFGCESTNDEFGETRRIECRLPKAPQKSFSPINNTYLTVVSTTTPKGYIITITPKEKMKLIPLAFDLTKEAATFQGSIKNAKHWSIVGYKQKLPLLAIGSSSDSSINFPVKINKDIRPFVGGVDLKGNPIKIARVQDVTDYMEMKKAY